MKALMGPNVLPVELFSSRRLNAFLIQINMAPLILKPETP